MTHIVLSAREIQLLRRSPENLPYGGVSNVDDPLPLQTA